MKERRTRSQFSFDFFILEKLLKQIGPVFSKEHFEALEHLKNKREIQETQEFKGAVQNQELNNSYEIVKFCQSSRKLYQCHNKRK